MLSDFVCSIVQLKFRRIYCNLNLVQYTSIMLVNYTSTVIACWSSITIKKESNGTVKFSQFTIKSSPPKPPFELSTETKIL